MEMGEAEIFTFSLVTHLFCAIRKRSRLEPFPPVDLLDPVIQLRHDLHVFAVRHAVRHRDPVRVEEGAVLHEGRGRGGGGGSDGGEGGEVGGG